MAKNVAYFLADYHLLVITNIKAISKLNVFMTDMFM